MPLVADLMAFGTDARIAGTLGNTPVALVATGTVAAQASAATVQPGTNIVILASTAAGAAVAFSTAWSLGTPVYILNRGGVTAGVFCPVGGAMNGTSNGSLTLTTGAGALFVQTTAGVWSSIPTSNQ